MCKIIVIPNASKINNMQRFSRRMASLMLEMRDGYGYAAQGASGVFGARSTSPNGYASGDGLPSYVEASAEVKFGEYSRCTGAAMFHGRISTNEPGLLNTHPISRDGWHMIHNGVVTNHGASYVKTTSNDSEDVLYHLMTGGIAGVSANLTGYYAAGAIDSDGLLHVFRDEIASLYYGYSDKLKSPVFATTMELLTKVGKIIGEKLSGVEVKENIYLVFDHGRLVHEQSFESRGYSEIEGRLASRSLGRELNGFSAYGDLTEQDSDNYLDAVSDSWLEEVETMNERYIIRQNGREVSLETFYMMRLAEQVECEIVRPDGTTVDPWAHNLALSPSDMVA
jgi:glutamine amidotransferase-like protein